MRAVESIGRLFSASETLQSTVSPPGDNDHCVGEYSAKVEALPRVKLLSDFQAPTPNNDSAELITHRFLCRGSVCLMLGPTGVGKSSFLMQLGIHLAVGKPLFGITPGGTFRDRGMRVLLIQAENDDGDLAEMRDGVLAGCTELTEEDRAQAQKRFMVSTINDRSGDRFIDTLDALLTNCGPLDLVILDPAFAYFGGDSNSQRDVSRFMRAQLNPLVQRQQVGLILAHHTNKPLRGREKENWKGGEYAYLGAGSAEWINAARAALALRSIGSDNVFELRAVKRGKRLRWQSDGVPTTTRLIAHHREPGFICWREAEPDEVQAVFDGDKGGRPRSCNLVDVLHCIAAHPSRHQGFYNETLANAQGCTTQAVQRVIHEAVKSSLVRFSRKGRTRIYHLTERGQTKANECPSSRDWKTNESKPHS